MRIHGIAVVVVAGCGTDSPSPFEPRSSVDLRVAMASGADVNPIGVSVTPDGQRFVFDESLGLYRIDGTAAIEVVRMDQMPAPIVPIQLPFTDVVAIAPGVFALTAINDGFLLDTTQMTMTQHFCYVPEGTPPSLTQRTDAIAYDPELDQIYAQPRTYEPNGNLLGSQLADYRRDTGGLLDWREVGFDVAAGGMAVVPGLGLVFGQGSLLDAYDLSKPQIASAKRVTDLGGLGVSSIQGLAYDASTDTLLVLDGSTDQLVEIDLD
jgi:hypothetical protein